MGGISISLHSENEHWEYNEDYGKLKTRLAHPGYDTRGCSVCGKDYVTAKKATNVTPTCRRTACIKTKEVSTG